MKMNSVKALSAVSLGLLLQTAFAGSITDIQVSVLPDKQRVVKLKFDKEMVEPSGFITATPARIALDFPGTNINVSQSALTFNDSLLSQIVAAQGSNHARILLSLAKEGQYSTQIKGNEVWVYVSEATTTNTAPVQAATPVAERASSSVQNAAASSAAPFNIDFRKGSSNAGVVEFTSAFSGEPKVSVQSDRIVITLKNYPLATRDQRNLDVTDFSTPIRSINVRRLGNDTQITLRNQGNWDHKISHSNGQYSIQVTPNRDVAAAGASQRPASFKGKTISLDFQNVDVRTVLQIIAKESGMNIVASDSVQGKMTLSLKDVPWDQALDLVLTARGLDMRKQGNIINIAPREELLEQTRKEMTARKDIEELGPLFTRSFQLKYKNVEEFKEILKLTDGTANNTTRNSILSSRGSALIDPSTNTLIITDNQKVIEKFEKLIEELDVAARQVMVEARIVEASDGVSRDLGVKFGVSRAGNTAWGTSFSDAINNNNVGRGIVTGSNTTQLLNPNVNLPVTTAAGTISLVRSMSSGALGLELSAMETDEQTKTISNPRVLTQDRKEAEIRQGIQIPYRKEDGDGNTTVEFKDAVMSLKVTPRITPDNKIILDIVINKDSPIDIAGQDEPRIDSKSVTTQAMIEDGGTLVVGGIYQEVYGNTIQKVPVLGDIPVLGNLFKSRSRNQSRNELLFFITPRIMGHEASVLRY